MAVNDHGNAPQGPEVIAKAMHPWALAEESAEVMALLGGEFGFTAGVPFGDEARVPLVRQHVPPATDGPR